MGGGKLLARRIRICAFIQQVDDETGCEEDGRGKHKLKSEAKERGGITLAQQQRCGVGLLLHGRFRVGTCLPIIADPTPP